MTADSAVAATGPATLAARASMVQSDLPAGYSMQHIPNSSSLSLDASILSGLCGTNSGRTAPRRTAIAFNAASHRTSPYLISQEVNVYGTAAQAAGFVALARSVVARCRTGYYYPGPRDYRVDKVTITSDPTLPVRDNFVMIMRTTTRNGPTGSGVFIVQRQGSVVTVVLSGNRVATPSTAAIANAMKVARSTGKRQLLP